MNRKWTTFFIVVVLCVAYVAVLSVKNSGYSSSLKRDQAQASPKQAHFNDNFNKTEVLQEQGKMHKSLNQNWWLNSGGQFIVKKGIAQTIQGRLPKSAHWRLKYASSNSGETDDGYRPQNIFRLVTRTKWQNFQQEAYFKITADNLSKSIHRQESNGLLLFNRYRDGDNLYYTGIRVDGAAVIKKKINGNYFTMAYKPIIDGAKYDRKSNPDLLPKNTWIGLRSVVKSNSNNTVSIKVYTDINRTGRWKLVLEAKDDGKRYGGKPFLDKQFAGIRTDFADVQFDDYKIIELN